MEYLSTIQLSHVFIAKSGSKTAIGLNNSKISLAQFDNTK